MKKNFYHKIILTILLVAGGFFSLAHAAHADYYPMGTALSTNLLSGKADVAQITFWKATATVPANTTLSVQYSQDGANFFDHNYVNGGWDTLAAGTNTIDLGALNWTTANFYYRVRFTTTDPAATAVLAQAEVDYSSTYTPWTPPWGTGYAPASSVVSTDLLSGLGTQFQHGAFFAYKISSLPAGTTATAQFSADGVNWFSSAGTAWATDTLSVGDHSIKTSALSLDALNWSGASSFYYKLNFFTNSSANSAIVTAAGLLFNNVQIGGAQSTDTNLGINNGLVGYWSFDGQDISGTTVKDLSGNGNNGTNNGATPTVGKRGQALSFNGTSSYVNIGNTNKSVNAVAFWVKPFSTSQSILDLDGGTHYIQINSGTVTASGFSSPVVYIDGAVTATFPDTQWHSVVITTATAFNASNVTLGKSTTNYFSGSLDEVRVYNRALTAGEVSQLYQTGQGKINATQAGTVKNGLVGQWTFDGATLSGTTASDSSGQGNNGTLVASPTPVLGKLGQALSFNGTNYVLAKSSPIVAGLPAWSVSAWINTTAPYFSSGRPLYSERSNTGSDILKLDSQDNASRGSALVTYRNDAGNLTQIRGTKVINDGNWHHIVGVLNSGYIYLYVDGVLDSSGSRVGNDTLTNSGIQAWIGRDYGDLGAKVVGSLDDVRVYNRALSATEVQNLYNGGMATIK